MTFSIRTLVAMVVGLSLVAAGCGDDDTGAGSGANPDLPIVVVTTNILGDVVEDIAGDALDVVTIMPVGADPHDFQASAQEVAEISGADVLIVNGGAFEEGLVDVIEAAEGDGVPVFEALSAVSTIEFGEGSHGHGDEDHSDEDDHGHDGADPHFWTDPARMAVAAGAIADFIVANVEGADADSVTANASALVAELEAVDVEVVGILAAIGDDDRVLVTNHDSFGYFGDRYGFEIAGTVIPSGSTTDGASARELTALIDLIEDEGVSAIFSETTVSDELAQTITSEVGADISIVELYTGSLGDAGSGADTYVAMVRTNAQRIADALAG